MKPFNLFLLPLFAGMLSFTACKHDHDGTPAPTPGKADFSRYIAVGNSLTSGYADGGLYLEGQQNSYPSIIAKQLQLAGGGAFTQPLFTEAQANGSGYLRVTGIEKDGSPKIEPVTTNLAVRGQITVPPVGDVILYTKYTGELNNYGVPGIKLRDITLAPYGNFNGFFERLLPVDAPGNTTSYLDFITAKPFTFFTNWLGNNDALAFATSGGTGDVLTDKAVFAQLYKLSVEKLTAAGQKGVVATIPDITSIPFLNTVTIAKILAGVQKVNPEAKALYVDAVVSGTEHNARVATDKDLVILTFDVNKIGQPVVTPQGSLPYGLTPYTPIEDKYVLDEKEAATATDYVVSFNNSIKASAAEKGLAVFDAFTFLNEVKAHGLQVNGLKLTVDFFTGGIFSLDGVHLTPRGYAVIANEFIKAINDKYQSSVPLVNVADYRAVKLP